MRVVVMGGAGFLGSHLCRALIERGDGVVAIDNLITGNLDNLADLADHRDFAFAEADVTEPFDVSGPVDAVLNFASPASPPDYLAYPIATLRVGSIGTQRGLDLALDKGARFLLASTSEVYGDPLVHPQNESYWGNVNPIGPRSVYDEAKRFAEAMTMTYHRVNRVDVRIVRIFNTYGPAMRPADGRAVSNFVNQALAGNDLTVYGDGSQTRSFCYVDDEVRGILALLASDYVGPMNIGSPDEHTIADLARRVLSVTGMADAKLCFDPLPVDDPRRRRPDISLAQRVLGWSPQISIDEGLASTVAWFRSTPPRGHQDL